MMNKSQIEWTDFTWNPVTGCLHGCEYCYAAKQARRFSGDVRLNKGSEQLRKDENGLYILDKPFRNIETGRVTPHPVGFEPVMHKYRLPMLAQKKKPAKIFVCSMADLFGTWVPDEWIEEVFKACDDALWHTYLFLTKNPSRYIELTEKGIIRKAKNYWYGTTITGQEDAYFWSDKLNTFASIEPILEEFEYPEHPCSGERLLKWVIIGAETGNRKGKVRPERTWIENIVKACKESKTPVFLKGNLEEVWGKKLIQEWPKGMPRDKSKPIPHCSKCEHYQTEPDGKRGNKHTCGLLKKRIPGRYARISPLWCPKREEDRL